MKTIAIENDDNMLVGMCSVDVAMRYVADKLASIIINNGLFFSAIRFIDMRKYPHIHYIEDIILFNRYNMYVRDNFTCQYCGKQFHNNVCNLSIDHVYPKSLGGKLEWTNCVTACIKCNNKKSDMPIDIYKDLPRAPFEPTVGQFKKMLDKVYSIVEK